MESREIRVTADSQVHELRAALERSQIHHGQEARVTVPNVKVRPAPYHPQFANLFFCKVGEIEVHSRSGAADNLPLPLDVALEGKKLIVDSFNNGEKFFSLVNARVWPNGVNHLIIDEQTRLVPMEESV